MTKGFLLAVAAIGGVFYVLHQSDPAAASGGTGSSGGRGSVEINGSNYDSIVANSSAPVLAYYWASW